ncbi:hypothetical protein KSS87_019760 [Heliosperma pusillum]|nr:hypothetical protein KSS87_019760 [Heliosperma pusillum]
MGCEKKTWNLHGSAPQYVPYPYGAPKGPQDVYVKAKECLKQTTAEDFAILLARHFTSFYKQVTGAIVKIVEKPWKRVYIDGQPHTHGFELGSEKHVAEVVLSKSGVLKVSSGIEDLALLKTTQSGFEGFIRDKYTLLPETRERLLATAVTATWRYTFDNLLSIPTKPLYFAERYSEVRKVLVDTFFGAPIEGVYSPSVQSTLYQMANAVLNKLVPTLLVFSCLFPCCVINTTENAKSAFPSCKLTKCAESKCGQGLMDDTNFQFADDVYLPTDEPHGSIEASLSRLHSKM